jgi:hypothetical protein
MYRCRFSGRVANPSARFQLDGTGGPAFAGEMVLLPHLSRRTTGGAFEFRTTLLVFENSKFSPLFSILQEESDTQADSSSGRT